MANRNARILQAVGHELKENPPKILSATKRKEGAAMAERQRRAILLSKARAVGAKV